MGNVMDAILLPAQAAWGELESQNQELSFEIYERILENYSKDVLDRAFCSVAAVWEPRFQQRWPVAATFKAACDRVIKADSPANTVVFDEPPPPPTPEQCAKANKMIAELMKIIQANNVSEQPSGKKHVAMNRDYFNGRYSAARGHHWHSASLAEVIARQDAAKGSGE
jgi:hypothetical protein